MQNKVQQVENMGVLFEKVGYSPMAGRVFAFLLLAEPPHKSFEEIREFLQASKSAISNSLRLLTDSGIVNYKTFSGDRKRYFMVNIAVWKGKLEENFRNKTKGILLLEEILAHRTDAHPAFNAGLKENLAMHKFMAAGIEKLLKEWKEKQ